MKPTGRLLAGGDLEITRTLRGSVDDVWASLTEPTRTARWYGPWRGEAAPGRLIEVQMSYEEGAPWCDMRIDACEPPRHLALSSTDQYGDWRLEVFLTGQGHSTELRFVQHLDPAGIGADEVGPGWEYYLDMLMAAHHDTPQPQFTDYFPALRPYYKEQADLLS